ARRLRRVGGVQDRPRRARPARGPGAVGARPRPPGRVRDGRRDDQRPRQPGRAGMSGRFYGVGVGPGDPELVTLKAARIIGEADVVAYHAGTGKQSMARSVAADLIPDGVLEEELRYPVTTGFTDHPRGYYGALADFYDECSQRLEAHLAAGRTVVVLAVGDPPFFGSFMYVHARRSPRYPTEVVPGITSLSAATAAVATGLCRHEDTLTVLPGTLAAPELARRLADTDAAIIMKLGRTFAGVREALRQAGMLEDRKSTRLNSSHVSISYA